MIKLCYYLPVFQEINKKTMFNKLTIMNCSITSEELMTFITMMSNCVQIEFHKCDIGISDLSTYPDINIAHTKLKNMSFIK